MQVTRIELPPPPEGVAKCLAKLRAANGRAWIVGGAVRDLLLGSTPEDYDLATDLLPEQVAAALPPTDLQPVDLRDGALGTCHTVVDGRALTITTLRAEGDYGDQRHPDQVAFVTDVAIDARRRDFTVNALYYDPAAAELLDPTGGHADLQARRLRAIGEPGRRFREDPLRLLRLVRFAAASELVIDPATAEGARATAAGLTSLSAERCYAELTRAFTGHGRGHALGLLVELGLAAVVLPEAAAMQDVPQPPEYHPEGDVLVHVKLVLDHVPANDPVLAWSAVLHDVGKPPTFRVAADRIRFDGHDTLSARMAEQVLQRLRAPKELREVVVDICRQHIRFAALPQMRPAKVERWLREPSFPQHLAFHRADCLASHGQLEIWELVRQRLQDLPPVAEQLLSGKDVLSLGVAAGPEVGKLLRTVETEIEESPTATSRRQALILLRDAVERHRQGPGSGAR